VARPRRCLTLSNPVSWQNWMAAYLGYTLRMRTLFHDWPIMVNDTHTRRRRLQTQSRSRFFFASHLRFRRWKPSAQSHRYEPTVLTHFSVADEHGAPSSAAAHSSTSAQNHIDTASKITRDHHHHHQSSPSSSSHRTETLWCLQKEMATYRHWSVSLWWDPDDVPHCRILSSDKTEWRLTSATLCRWRRYFVADQLWFMTCIQEED